MKLLEKFALILFSLFIFIISVALCLFIFGIIDMENVKIGLDFLKSNQTATIIALATAVVCILLSVRCIFFRKRKEIKKSDTTDILLENDAGRLLISKHAIENAVKNIIDEKMIANKNTQVTVDIDPANNISIYIIMFVEKTEKVRDLTVGLQMEIIQKIKENFDLDIKQVNIKVDNIEKEPSKETKKVENQNNKKSNAINNKKIKNDNDKELIEINPEEEIKKFVEERDETMQFDSEGDEI